MTDEHKHHEHKHHEEEHHRHHKIKLVFITTAGDFKGEFPVHDILAVVKLEVMEKLHLDVKQAGDFAVSHNGKELDEKKTLEQLGLKNGEELFIERRQVVKV